VCFFALLDALGILGILKGEQRAMIAVLVAEEAVRQSTEGQGGSVDKRLGAGCGLGGRSGRSVAKYVTMSE
jgi:hypothetical protein